MIRIFGKERQTLTSDVDTWIVKWKTYKYHFSDGTYPNIQECYKAFTNKNEAEAFAKALNDAMKLLCMTSLPDAKVYLQETNSV